MQLYLTIIGLISIISCVLILVFINNKAYYNSPLTPNSYSNTQSPIDNDSKSPLTLNKRRGLTQIQKSQLLLIVCLIFFCSLVVTNIKTSKFHAIINKIWPANNQADLILRPHVIDLNQMFFGVNKNCLISDDKKTRYPIFMRYLKQTGKYENFVKDMIQKNYQGFSLANNQAFSHDNQINSHISSSHYDQQQLIVFKSLGRHSGGDQILPRLTQNICLKKSLLQNTPVLYLDLQKDQPLNTESQLMQQLNFQNYETLKQAICKFNGIEIRKESGYFNNNEYYYEKQIYEQTAPQPKSKRQNVYLVINNFENILQTIIANKNFLNVKNNKPLSNIQPSIKDDIQLSTSSSSNSFTLGPKYSLFIEKLFIQIVNKCKTNVIMYTQNQKALNNLYNKWKIFSQNQFVHSSRDKSTSYFQREFPFQIKDWRGLRKMELYELLKQIIEIQPHFKGNETPIWKTFEKTFGNILGSNNIKATIGSTVYHHTHVDFTYQNSEYFSFEQIEQFFQSLQKQFKKQILSPTPNPTIIPLQKKYNAILSLQNDPLHKIAQYYGLLNIYNTIRNLIKSKPNQNGVRIGQIKKKIQASKISLKELEKLQEIGLISIRQGTVYLTK